MSGKTTLLAPALGDVTFPITPTSMDGMVIGASAPAAGTFTTVAAPNGAFGSVTVSSPVTVGGLAAVANSINVSATTNNFTAALALTAAINVISSAAFTSGGPVVLPSVGVFLGTPITVFNQSNHTVAIYPNPNNSIDVLGTTTAILLDAAKRANFYGVALPNATTALGQIISAQLGVTAV